MAHGEPKDLEVIEEYEDRRDNKAMTGFANIPPRYILFLGLGILIFLISRGGELDIKWVIGLAAGTFALIIFQKSAEKQFTDKPAAEKLARHYLKNKQKEGTLYNGKIVVRGYGRMTEGNARRHIINCDLIEQEGMIHHYVVVVDADRGEGVLCFYVTREGFDGMEYVPGGD